MQNKNTFPNELYPVRAMLLNIIAEQVNDFWASQPDKPNEVWATLFKDGSISIDTMPVTDQGDEVVITAKFLETGSLCFFILTHMDARVIHKHDNKSYFLLYRCGDNANLQIETSEGWTDDELDEAINGLYEPHLTWPYAAIYIGWD